VDSTAYPLTNGLRCVLIVIADMFQVWRANDMGGWDEEQTLHGHKDWVRDAVWAPNLGMPLNTIASAGQDGQVCWVCVGGV
jgi:WD40 repeat protein